MTEMRITNRFITAALIATAALSATACGDVSRTGQSPVYVVLEELVATQGNKATGGGSSTKMHILTSDVITNVTSPAPCAPDSPCPTVFNDIGTATLSIAAKDIFNGTDPTSNNAVTFNRYHVSYTRADGRNTPGVDVPYGFDGAATITVLPGAKAGLTFELVRHVAKQETPLVQLRANNAIITTLADVTFYGQDQVGNDVVVKGTIQIDFGNFGDQ